MEITHVQREAFDRDGFLVLERFFDLDQVERLRDRLEPLFRGEFETGIYPDEWYWREGMSLPDVTRHMANAWKSDRTVAKIATSSAIGQIGAQLAGWPGARLGQDTIWWKTSGAKEIAHHQDATFISYLQPAEMMTFWIALDDTHRDGGTLEYVPGSHKWPLKPDIGDFHAPEAGYQRMMMAAAQAAGVQDPKVVPIEVPAGSILVHHGRTWHGSARNERTDLVRRSIGVHLLSSETRFAPDGASYIYGRYQRRLQDGSFDTAIDESFFPILWREDGYRTPFLG